MKNWIRNKLAKLLGINQLQQCNNFNCGMHTVYTKYRIEYGSTNFYGAYLGDSIEDLHNAIDSDKRLDSDPELRDLLKYGYFGEFINGQYITKEYVIDNCMHVMWNVRYGKEFI